MPERERRPRIDIADTVADIDAAWDEWDDETPRLCVPSPRARLFKVLAWSGGGFAALSGLSLALAGQVSGIAFLGGALAAGLGVAGFAGVFAMASRLEHRIGAHLLLWVTTVFYAVLISLFAAAFGFNPLLAAGAVAATGFGVLAVLAIAVGFGFGAVAMSVRWVIFIGLATGAWYAIDPELWWVGLVAGSLVAITVEMTLAAGLEAHRVPRRRGHRNRHPRALCPHPIRRSHRGRRSCRGRGSRPPLRRVGLEAKRPCHLRHAPRTRRFSGGGPATRCRAGQQPGGRCPVGRQRWGHAPVRRRGAPRFA